MKMAFSSRLILFIKKYVQKAHIICIVGIISVIVVATALKAVSYEGIKVPNLFVLLGLYVVGCLIGGIFGMRTGSILNQFLILMISIIPFFYLVFSIISGFSYFSINHYFIGGSILLGMFSSIKFAIKKYGVNFD